MLRYVGAIANWHGLQFLYREMSIAWHDHFATLYSKVLHIGWLKTENETIRENALGTFRNLITAVAKDNAMEYFLDQWISTRTNPNENWGREFLELFTMGVGHYAEAD